MTRRLSLTLTLAAVVVVAYYVELSAGWAAIGAVAARLTGAGS